ncbi:hypothetical protein ACVWW4_003448 [Bradyrhizobium sp. LB7.1]
MPVELAELQTFRFAFFRPCDLSRAGIATSRMKVKCCGSRKKSVLLVVTTSMRWVSSVSK